MLFMRPRSSKIISTISVATLLTGSYGFAGDYYTTVTPSGVMLGGSGAQSPDTVTGKEYSHSDWYSVFIGSGIPVGDPNLVNYEDHDAFAIPDPEQVVAWDGIAGPTMMNSGSTDSFDFSSSRVQDPQDREVDALANQNDFLFDQVLNNRAALLFSVTGDIDSIIPDPDGAGPLLPDPNAKAHVHYVDPLGGHGEWADIERPIDGNLGPGVNHHTVEDLDALEVWGSEPDPTDPAAPLGNANMYSLDNDPGAGGPKVSIWKYDGIVSSTPYLFHSDVVMALSAFADLNGDGLIDQDEANIIETIQQNLDVDATMVEDENSNGVFDGADRVLFSIDPIINPINGTLLFDGGEIFVLSLSPNPSASFLTHGGYTWNTAFDVRGTFGYFYEDVDALEAVGTEVPEPQTYLLLGSMLGVAALKRKRKAVNKII